MSGRISSLGAGLLAALMLLVAGCPGERTAEVSQVRSLFGALVTIDAYGADRELLDEAVEAAFEEMEELQLLLDVEDPGSQIAAVNRAAGREDVEVDPRLIELLLIAREWWHRSDGAFDPSVLPVLRRWGIPSGEGPGMYPPAMELIERDLRRVGMDKIVVNDISSTVRLDREGMGIDLGAMAPGYAVDRAVEILRERGVEAARVDAEDVVRVFGPAPDGEAWLVDIPHPRDPERILTRMPLDDQAVAWTLDAKKRVFVRASQKYHTHVVDPRTGLTVEETVLVVVRASEASTADALSTAAFVLGRSAGGFLVRDVEGAEALFVDWDPEAPTELRGGVTSGLRGEELDVDL